jgi:hypothetical protein
MMDVRAAGLYPVPVNVEVPAAFIQLKPGGRRHRARDHRLLRGQDRHLPGAALRPRPQDHHRASEGHIHWRSDGTTITFSIMRNDFAAMMLRS